MSCGGVSLSRRCSGVVLVVMSQWCPGVPCPGCTSRRCPSGVLVMSPSLCSDGVGDLPCLLVGSVCGCSGRGVLVLIRCHGGWWSCDARVVLSRWTRSGSFLWCPRDVPVVFWLCPGCAPVVCGWLCYRLWWCAGRPGGTLGGVPLNCPKRVGVPMVSRLVSQRVPCCAAGAVILVMVLLVSMWVVCQLLSQWCPGAAPNAAGVQLV